MIDPINLWESTKATVIEMANLDETDRRILTVLDRDPRRPVALIAQDLGLARGTVHARLDRLRIRRVSARPQRAHPSAGSGARRRGLDPRRARSAPDHRRAIDALSRVPEVLECFAPAGDTDLLLRVVAKDPDDLYRVAEVVRLCPGILRTSTSLFLREVIPYRVSALLQAG